MKPSLSFMTYFQKILASIVIALLVFSFYLSRREEDKWERLQKGLAESFGESPVSATDSPVYVIDLDGEARYKRPTWLNWWNLKPGIELQPGDLVYVEDMSKVVLFFASQDSIVTLPEGSLFYVGVTIPQVSKLRTSGGLSSNAVKNSDGKIVSKASSARFSTRIVQNPNLQKAEAPAKKENEQGPEVSAYEDLQIIRNTRTLRVRYPSPYVEIYASKFPTSFPLTFEVDTQTGKLWGYLWSEREIEPMWSSVSVGGFPSVPVNKPGIYFFQATSEDELYASPAIMIRAFAREVAGLMPTPVEWIEGTRIFQ
jgi:hypothetical protein